MSSQHVLFVADDVFCATEKRHLILPPSKVDDCHDVFAEAMLEDNSTRQRRSPLDWVVSIGVHFAILSGLLILPLYFTAGLDYQKLNLMFLAAPPMPAAAPPAPMMSSSPMRIVRPASLRPSNPSQLTAPSFISKAVSIATAGEEGPPDDAMLGLSGGVPGGIPGGQAGGVVGGVLEGIAKSAPPPPASAVAEGPKGPVRVGGRVKPPQLIFGPEPEYPVLARQSKLSGMVIIEAIIDEHGNVKGMQVVSGHPLLIPSALTAVSKRKYEPTILDGEPTAIDLRVEIRFTFS
jgi:periplasmic protein TonB